MTLGGVGLSEGFMGSFEGSKSERRLRRAGSIPALSTMGVRDGRCVREGIVPLHLHQFCGQVLDWRR